MTKGFGGMPGNLNKLMQQAQKMQEELQKAQAQAAEIKVEASVGGGMVKAVARGDNQLVSVTIEKEVVNPNDVEMLQDLIVAVVNEAMKKAGDEVQSRINKIAGGLSLGGLK
jgi:nucleoid-associated protein EbfC